MGAAVDVTTWLLVVAVPRLCRDLIRLCARAGVGDVVRGWPSTVIDPKGRGLPVFCPARKYFRSLSFAGGVSGTLLDDADGGGGIRCVKEPLHGPWYGR